MITKQVIVMRADLGMSPGKMAAQAAHASISFITRRLTKIDVGGYWVFDPGCKAHAEEIEHWLEHDFTKVTLFVDSPEELEDLHIRAQEGGLMVHSIIDSGKTEFNGVPTVTCIAIGPHDICEFVGLTDGLRTTLNKPSD
jgi:PTH2 family peptidyl-tRNA hydrolase